MAVGVICVAAGAIFVVLGVVAAVHDVLRSIADKGDRGAAFDPGAWAKLVESLTELVKVAPQWLLLTLTGVGLMVFGGTQL